jgi:hypothetical protein
VLTPRSPPNSCSSWLNALCAAALLAACATPTPAPAPPPAPAQVVVPPPLPAPEIEPAPVPIPAPVVSLPSPGASALRDGVLIFNQGEYRRAETKLNESQKLGLDTTIEQVLAHKIKAFIYCITRRTALCEKSFESAFSALKTFDLTRAERGHPVWGPVFAKVQKKQAK